MNALGALGIDPTAEDPGCRLEVGPALLGQGGHERPFERVGTEIRPVGQRMEQLGQIVVLTEKL